MEDCTPADLAFALSDPELDPLCGELVQRVLSRKILKKEDIEKSALSGSQRYYDGWNEKLGQKMHAAFKQFLRFKSKI